MSSTMFHRQGEVKHIAGRCILREKLRLLGSPDSPNSIRWSPCCAKLNDEKNTPHIELK